MIDVWLCIRLPLLVNVPGQLGNLNVLTHLCIPLCICYYICSFLSRSYDFSDLSVPCPILNSRYIAALLVKEISHYVTQNCLIVLSFLYIAS